LAAQAGLIANLPKETVENLRLTAFVHDIGKCAINNRIWYKESDLAMSERLEMERHTYQTQYYLSHGRPFLQWARVAASVHERADGSGYHRGAVLTDLASNILAAANEYDELTHAMPNRVAVKPEKAVAIMNAAAREKKFLPMAVAAVLQAAGHKVSDAQASLPFGLTKREAQVLSRLAKSETTAEIADGLGISPKTADHHIQNIYNKTEVRARPALALLALEHRLVTDSGVL
jgi:HD-GYP domain-containing protein (c-di-GMP phosphodiesterase class II)